MNSKATPPKLHKTRDYRQFSLAKENRPIDVLKFKPQHSRLKASMSKHGFLPAFPLMVRNVGGRLVIIDGQHRFTFAREFGLEVFYVIVDQEVSISEINQAQAGWTPRDYAASFAAQGKADYRTGIAFCEQYGIPIGTGFGMLAGTITFGNVQARFSDGTYRITSADLANRVASIYKQLCEIRKGSKNVYLLNALWACCHVPYFDESRILGTAEKRPDMVHKAGTLDGYLSMLEEIYNFKRHIREPLKFDAQQAMRDKNPAMKGAK